MNIFSKVATGILATILAIGLLPGLCIFAQEYPISMLVNGQMVNSEVPPYIENGRTMVPLRFISEALGAKVDWDGTTNSVTVTGNDNVIIKLRIGNMIMIVEKSGSTENVKMDAAACIKESRTFVPVRFIAEALELRVDWYDVVFTRSITFTSKDYRNPVLNDFPDGFVYKEQYQFKGDYGDGLSPRKAALKAVEMFLELEKKYVSEGETAFTARPITVILTDLQDFDGVKGYIYDFSDVNRGLFQCAVAYNGTLYEFAGRGYILYKPEKDYKQPDDKKTINQPVIPVYRSDYGQWVCAANGDLAGLLDKGFTAVFKNVTTDKSEAFQLIEYNGDDSFYNCLPPFTESGVGITFFSDRVEVSENFQKILNNLPQSLKVYINDKLVAGTARSESHAHKDNSFGFGFNFDKIYSLSEINTIRIELRAV
jgi:hypothetical protein